MNNFAESMTLFLITSVLFLVTFIKRHWKLTLAAFIAFLIYRHFFLKVN